MSGSSNAVNQEVRETSEWNEASVTVERQEFAETATAEIVSAVAEVTTAVHQVKTEMRKMNAIMQECQGKLMFIELLPKMIAARIKFPTDPFNKKTRRGRWWRSRRGRWWGSIRRGSIVDHGGPEGGSSLQIENRSIFINLLINKLMFFRFSRQSFF